MKNARQTAILSIIEQNDIETQEELAGKLRDMGIVVTQATVSRDIKELRLLKVLSGSANVAGEAIDSMRLPEILGTMAGDNTVFAVVQNEAEAVETVKRFQEMLK